MPEAPTVIVPTVGRVVHYTLSAYDASDINKRRQDARASEISAQNSGAVVHAGNPVFEGQVFPLVITRVWGPGPESAVNGQVLLDGNDTLWVTSRQQGDGHGHWRVPPRV